MRGWGLLLIGVIACGDNQSAAIDAGQPDASVPPPPAVDAGPIIDLSEALFDPERLLHIDIVIDESDWDGLRHQFTSVFDMLGGDCFAEPYQSPYTYFPASVTIDGTLIDNVAVRKKGRFGSRSLTKPSMKIKLDHFVPGQGYSGVDRLTLNNARQDPSFINMCLGYKLFREAGVPAPRCNFATVTVNGEDKGVYAHVESIKKPFLRRQFGNDSGNLYEGGPADLRTGWQNMLENKWEDRQPGDPLAPRPDIDALVNVLENAADDDLVAQLGQHIDLDAFYTFWAMEILVGHVDGYAGNVNNFYLYRDPANGLFDFIPWGADAIFFWHRPIMAQGILTSRLYSLPSEQARYVTRVGELLDSVWDETAILSEIDRMASLIAPHVENDPTAFQNAIAGRKSYVENARQRFTDDFALGPPAWDEPLKGSPCIASFGSVTATFSGIYGQWTNAAATVTHDLTVTNSPVASARVLANQRAEPFSLNLVVQSTLESGEIVTVSFWVNPDYVGPGKTAVIDSLRAVAWGSIRTPPQPASQSWWMGQGSVTFTEGALTPGAPISGTLTATAYESPIK
jgi:hypothetical protein